MNFAGCKDKQWAPVQNRFFDKIEFGDAQNQTLESLYELGFRNAVTHAQDLNFEIQQDNKGNSFKIMVLEPGDTTGFLFNGMRWRNLQIQIDKKGLFSLTMYSVYAPRDTVEKQYVKLLDNLARQHYLMSRAIVGTSQIEGEKHDIVGHRYEYDNRQVIMHTNDEANGYSCITLSYHEQ